VAVRVRGEGHARKTAAAVPSSGLNVPASLSVGAIIMDVVVWLRSLGLGKYEGKLGVPRMPNLLEQAISSDDADHAARILQDALGIESDDVANYCFPKTWPADREQRASIIGDWLQTEARFLA
jgi:hypothetical protein